MEIKEFVYYLFKEGKQFVKHDPHSEFRPSIAAMSSLLTFACDFKDSKCMGERRPPMCCCSGCRDFNGHFGSRWPNELDKLEPYAKYFSKNTGFWRKGKGCALPRHMRSLTCAFHVCNTTKQEFDKRNDKDLKELRRVVGRYTSCDYQYGSRMGVYHKEVFETETALNKLVGQIMWNRMLHYDYFTDELLRITERNIDDRGWVHITLENGRKSSSNADSIPKGVKK